MPLFCTNVHGECLESVSEHSSGWNWTQRTMAGEERGKYRQIFQVVGCRGEQRKRGAEKIAMLCLANTLDDLFFYQDKKRTYLSPVLVSF